MKQKVWRFSVWGPEGRETLKRWRAWFDSIGVKSCILQSPETGLTALYRNGEEWPTTPEEEDVTASREG